MLVWGCGSWEIIIYIRWVSPQMCILQTKTRIHHTGIILVFGETAKQKKPLTTKLH